jgi:hypothetical protein
LVLLLAAGCKRDSGEQVAKDDGPRPTARDTAPTKGKGRPQDTAPKDTAPKDTAHTDEAGTPKDTPKAKGNPKDQVADGPAAITMTLADPMFNWIGGDKTPTLSGAVGYKVTSGKAKPDATYYVSVVYTTSKGKIGKYPMKAVTGRELNFAPEGSFVSIGFKCQIPDPATGNQCEVVVEEAEQPGGPRALVVRLADAKISGKAPTGKSP